MNPDTVSDEALTNTLKALQRVLFEYPIAAQAAFSALVAEGRHYEQTAAGKMWKQRLAESELVREGRVVWEAVSQGAFCESPDVALPRVFVDAIARACAVNGLEPMLSRLFEQDADDEETR